MCYLYAITGYGPPVTGYGPRVTSYHSTVTGYALPFVPHGHTLHVCYLPHIPIPTLAHALRYTIHARAFLICREYTIIAPRVCTLVLFTLALLRQKICMCNDRHKNRIKSICLSTVIQLHSTCSRMGSEMVQFW